MGDEDDDDCVCVDEWLADFGDSVVLSTCFVCVCMFVRVCVVYFYACAVCLFDMNECVYLKVRVYARLRT